MAGSRPAETTEPAPEPQVRYLAVQNIMINGVLAYAVGDFVHPDNVALHDLGDAVKKA